MSKASKSILRGAHDALAFLRGDTAKGRTTVVMVPARIDARAIRRKLGMSQAEFAANFLLNVRTLQDWEQGRAQPEGPARVLLTIIDREPRAVKRAIAAYAKDRTSSRAA
jgi:putative transcriptional regulator